MLTELLLASIQWCQIHCVAGLPYNVDDDDDDDIDDDDDDDQLLPTFTNNLNSSRKIH